MSYANYEKDNDNIVTITMDDPGSSVNVMNDAFLEGLLAMAAYVEQHRDDIAGVILTSGKETFFAGGDLEEILAVSKDTVGTYFDKVMTIKAAFRRLEMAGRPIVVAINGAALGGGYELCLATHHRIALDSKKVVIGMPEVTLGLLPGGGGVVKLVRMLGLEKAWPFLSKGTTVGASAAQAAGLIDEVAADKADMMSRARQWILANPDAAQAWDTQGYSIPGGDVTDKAVQNFIVLTTAKLQATKKGLYPAPQAILSAAVEGMQVDFDAANRIETRYLSYLATTQVAKNMITTFFQLNQLKSGASRPSDHPASSVRKLGILGAGMMGSGIAYAAAAVGLEVVLKDVSQEAADKGKSYTDTVASKLIQRGAMTEAKKQDMLSLILATDKVEDLEGCDLVIEAVFEDRDLKARVTQETESQLADEAVFASNTSTLPITGLAAASRSPGQFIGLHFFSPVDRMPLVEIICGEKTTEETLVRAYDFVRQIRKLPIVVSDSRDFYTSRVYESYCNEGAWLLSDGVDAALIENLAQQTGMPAGPLASVDAVSQKLVHSVKSMAKRDTAAEGRDFPAGDEPPYVWIDRMVNEFERQGKAYGAGYYEYPAGAKKFLWPELKRLQPAITQEVSHQDIKDRILFRQCIEAVRCLEEGVLHNVVDCNIGSMKGIGFPVYTGGQLQYINAFGVAEFAERSKDLAARFGDRFAPPKMLLEMAANGGRFE